MVAWVPAYDRGGMRCGAIVEVGRGLIEPSHQACDEGVLDADMSSLRRAPDITPQSKCQPRRPPEAEDGLRNGVIDSTDSNDKSKRGQEPPTVGRDKQELFRLAHRGHVVERPWDHDLFTEGKGVTKRLTDAPVFGKVLPSSGIPRMSSLCTTTSMKLTKARITNFRSVEDSGEFTTPHTTCLVGKNESGKTAALLALASLNPHPATPFVLDRERDYPRRYLMDYDVRHENKEATVLRTVWELDEPEKKAIEAAYGPGVLKSNLAVAVRQYGDSPPIWTLPINDQVAVSNAMQRVRLDAPERAPLNHAADLDALLCALLDRPTLTAKQRELADRLDSSDPGGAYGMNPLLTSFLPKFMYFSTYDRMAGEVRLEHLRPLENDTGGSSIDIGNKLFHEFMQYAGVSLSQILDAPTFESFRARLQGASRRITDQVLEYWHQNQHIEVRITVDSGKPEDPSPFNAGTIARARIYNQLHGVDVPFSERSAGFIWFFSFLVKFAQLQDEDVPTILLLDEPGLTLHGKAQADLLRFFEERLSPKHQLFYTTHSPFMVDPTRLTSARIVEDVVKKPKRGRPYSDGAKVREDVLRVDPDTIFPLQGALGYEITQTLFVGKDTLLVEGPSDILYLKALSAALARRNRTSLDPRWTICPTGGIGKVMPFISLFGGNEINVAVLADVVHGQKGKVEELRKTEILRSGAVLPMTDFVDKDEADIEDLFAPGLLAEIINRAYRLPQEAALTPDSLESADFNTLRQIKIAEDHFNCLSDPDLPPLDHYKPAEWLFDNQDILDLTGADVEETLDRAEELCNKVNSLLNSDSA